MSFVLRFKLPGIQPLCFQVRFSFAFYQVGLFELRPSFLHPLSLFILTGDFPFPFTRLEIFTARRKLINFVLKLYYLMPFDAEAGHLLSLQAFGCWMVRLQMRWKPKRLVSIHSTLISTAPLGVRMMMDERWMDQAPWHGRPSLMALGRSVRKCLPLSHLSQCHLTLIQRCSNRYEMLASLFSTLVHGSVLMFSPPIKVWFMYFSVS